MNVGEAIYRWLERKVITEKNIERFVKYYWLISTFRLALGFTIMLLILLAGYEFEDLLPK